MILLRKKNVTVVVFFIWKVLKSFYEILPVAVFDHLNAMWLNPLIQVWTV